MVFGNSAEHFRNVNVNFDLHYVKRLNKCNAGDKRRCMCVGCLIESIILITAVFKSQKASLGKSCPRMLRQDIKVRDWLP